VRQLSLDDALASAEAKSPELAIAHAGVTRAEGQRSKARSQFLPQLFGSAGYTRTLKSQFSGLSFGSDSGGPPACSTFTPNPDAPTDARLALLESALGCGAGSNPFGSLQNLGFGAPNQWNLGLSLQQNVFTGGRVTAQYRAANAGKRSAAIGLTAAKAQLTLDVTQAYYDAQLADQLVPLLAVAHAMDERAFTYDLADGHPRIERGIRVLEDHLEVAPDLLHPGPVGGVGLGAVAASKSRGARTICVDVDDDKLELARATGGAHTINTLQESLHNRLLELTEGRGPDVVIEASGAPDAVTQALDMVRDGGRVVICGHYTDNGSVSIHPHFQINRKHVEIKGCWGARYDHFHRAVALTAKYGHLKPWRQMVSGRYDLEHAGDALTAVENRTTLKAIITPNPGLLA